MPAEVLVPQVQAFDGPKRLTLLEAEWSVLAICILEALECVKVAAVIRDVSSRIATLQVQRWHFDPLLV